MNMSQGNSSGKLDLSLIFFGKSAMNIATPQARSLADFLRLFPVIPRLFLGVGLLVRGFMHTVQPLHWPDA